MDPYHDIHPLRNEIKIPIATNLDAVCQLFAKVKHPKSRKFISWNLANLFIAKIFFKNTFQLSNSRKYIQKVSLVFWLAKVSLAKVSTNN